MKNRNEAKRRQVQEFKYLSFILNRRDNYKESTYRNYIEKIS